MWLNSKSSSSLSVRCVLSTGRPGGSAVHRLRPEGADQTLPLLRGLREPTLLPGNHVQRSGKTTHFATPLLTSFRTRLCLRSTFPLRCRSAECASRSGHLHLHPGAVPVGASAAGDAGQHGGDDRGESQSGRNYPVSCTFIGRL